jgi:hypothetical protein
MLSFGRKTSREIIDIVGIIILRLVLENWGMTVWTGFIWLRIGTSGGLL